MPNLPAGIIVPINSSGSSIKKVKKIDPATFVVNAIDNGARGIRVTIAFDIPESSVVPPGTDENSLGNKAHWGFDGAGPSVKTKFDVGLNSLLLKQVAGTRNVTFNLDFVLTDGKIGGAGPTLKKPAKKSAAKKKKQR